MKKLTTAAIAGAISMMLLAGVWHELIMAQFYVEASNATHEGTGIIFIAYIILATLMTYLFSLIYKGNKPVIEGAKFGAIIGVLWVFPHELTMAAAHGEAISYAFKNAIWHIVEQGFGGGVIGFVYGKFHG